MHVLRVTTYAALACAALSGVVLPSAAGDLLAVRSTECDLVAGGNAGAGAFFGGAAQNCGGGGGGGDGDDADDSSGPSERWEAGCTGVVDDSPGLDLPGVVCGALLGSCIDGTVMDRVDNESDAVLDSVCVEDADAPPTVTPALVLAEFRAVPLPESTIVVQPPGALTMVNFLTIFHTGAEAFTTDLTLLGQSVRLEITPTSYAWSHGDGTNQTTSTPDRPYAEGVAESSYVGQYEMIKIVQLNGG